MFKYCKKGLKLHNKKKVIKIKYTQLYLPLWDGVIKLTRDIKKPHFPTCNKNNNNKRHERFARKEEDYGIVIALTSDILTTKTTTTTTTTISQRREKFEDRI